MNRHIISLQSKDKWIKSIHLVGGKAANLLKLSRFGFRTAPGFIITTAAFKYLKKQLSLLNQTKTSASNLSEFQAIKNTILSLSLGTRLERKIRTFQQKLNGFSAVRSSMVGEDQHNASFAGQLDTYLRVGPDKLIPAIKECYASIFKPEVIRYISIREEDSDFTEQGLQQMAVIVQQMVNANAAGIAFTADPNCGRREVIIEATPGTGEHVVAGTINPDRYVVNANGELAEMSPVKKNSTILAQEQILQLAELSNRISHKMGFPQDIEWAWDGSDFIFLQTRPISTLMGKHIYSNKLVADMSPGLVKPLQWSTYSLAMSRDVFGRLFKELLGQNNLDFSRAIRLIHSRIYADITFFEEIFPQVGLPVNFFEVIARDEKGRRQRPKLTSKLIKTILFHFLPFIWKYARISNQMQEFIQQQQKELCLFHKQNWTGIKIDEKFYRLNDLVKLHNKAQWSIILVAMNMMIRNSLLKKLVRKHSPSVQTSDLLKGLPHLKGLQPNQELARLARLLAPLGADTIKTCMEADDQTIRQHLKNSKHGRKLVDEFDKIMQTFGHLSANTTNFTETPWIENPEMIWHSIASNAESLNSHNPVHSAGTHQSNKDDVLKHLNFVQSRFFRYLLNSTIDYLTLREKISLLLSDDTYQFRRLALSIAEDLVEQKILNKSDDIFYLFLDELETIIKGTKTADFANQIEQRRKQLKLDTDIIPEDTICGEQLIARRRDTIGDSEFLTGICGSSGIKRGYAYVVENPQDMDKDLTADDILVVPFTHVGWTPLFPKIGGIIAETGGQLSHTSIIAREYGIPAVVNVRHAMHVIKRGQALTLDADNGRIYLKHSDLNEGEEI